MGSSWGFRLLKAQTHQAEVPLPLNQKTSSLDGKRASEAWGRGQPRVRGQLGPTRSAAGKQGGNKGRRGHGRLPRPAQPPSPGEQMGPWALPQARASPASGALRLSQEKEEEERDLPVGRKDGGQSPHHPQGPRAAEPHRSSPARVPGAAHTPRGERPPHPRAGLAARPTRSPGAARATHLRPALPSGPPVL